MTKNLIFDFGGVLYGIDYAKSWREMAKLSSNPEAMAGMSMNEFIDIPQKFERGEISPEDFRTFLRESFYMTGSDDELDTAFNAMLLGIEPESTSFLRELKSKYGLALLSNTNAIHYEYFKEECGEMLTEFDHLFLSFQIGMRKPDENTFRFVLDKTGFFAGETLFIDDGIRNLSGASNLGIRVFHYSSEKKLSDLLHSI